MQSVNPATGEVTSSYETDDAAAVRDALETADDAARSWAERPATDEELFGPVAVLMEVSDVDEVVEVANDTNYGLGASIWTEDRDRAESIARRIDTGQVFVNAVTSSDPRVPFGGVKDSGYGRELGEAGLKEWVNRKTVWVE